LVNTQAKAGGIFKNGYRRKRPRGITADGLANRSANAVDQSNEQPAQPVHSKRIGHSLDRCGQKKSPRNRGLFRLGDDGTNPKSARSDAAAAEQPIPETTSITGLGSLRILHKRTPNHIRSRIRCDVISIVKGGGLQYFNHICAADAKPRICAVCPLGLD
jgi:hypothetical protein